MRLTIVLIYVLIAYGSLFPFNFSLLEFNQQYSHLLSIKISGLGDILGNIALFVPLGLLYAIYIPQKKTEHQNGNWLVLFKVFIFAIVLQVLQIALPGRDQNITDVAFNLLGFLIAYYTFTVLKFPFKEIMPKLSYLPTAIALTYFLSELTPFVPSLDFQVIKDSIKPIIAMPTTASFWDILSGTIIWLLVIRLLSFNQEKIEAKGLLLLWLALLLAKTIIYANYLSIEHLIAPLLAIGINQVINLHEKRITQLLFFISTVHFTISSLSYFGQTTIQPEIFIPFHAYLSGQLYLGMQVILFKLFFFSALIWLALELTWPIKKVGIILACGVAALEVAQLLMPTRTTDFADVVLVFIAYSLIRNVGDYLVTQSSSPEGELQEKEITPFFILQSWRDSLSLNITLWQKVLMRLTASYLVFYFIIASILAMPSTPYNVLELFRNGGSFWDLLFFYCAIILFYVASFASGKVISVSNKVTFDGLKTSFLASSCSYLFLLASVSHESLMDIIGSSVVIQRIGERGVLGDGGIAFVSFFGANNLKLITDVFEPIIRFWALTGPVIFFISIAFSAYIKFSRQQMSFGEKSLIIAKIIIYYLPWFWLCKLIVFDWSSTDNLNELIARPGDYGLGGGGYLYLLLLLTCYIGVSLAWGRQRFTQRKTFSLYLLMVFSIPLTWWLLNKGLVTNFTKYKVSYSGVDFLLGPDRTNKLAAIELFYRWALLYVIGILVIYRCGILYISSNLKELAVFKEKKSNKILGEFINLKWKKLVLGTILLSFVGGAYLTFNKQNRFLDSANNFKVDRSTADLPEHRQVGHILLNGTKIDSLAQAFSEATDFSVIELSAGYYNEAAVLHAKNVSIFAEPGAIIFGKSAESKGALVIKGNDTYIEGLECHSIYVPDNNGVCIRLEGKGIHLNNVYLHHAQGGLLGSHKGGDIRIENSRFEHLGDGEFYHGIYTLEETRLFINNSSFLNNRNGGHEIKSRSYHTEITNSVVASSQSRDSRLIDAPNGGVLIIRNNTLIEGPFSENLDLISWGVEGNNHAVERVIVESNTIISDKNRARLISLNRKPIVFSVRDNIVVGNIEGIPETENLFFKDRAELSIPAAPYIPQRPTAHK